MEATFYVIKKKSLWDGAVVIASEIGDYHIQWTSWLSEAKLMNKSEATEAYNLAINLEMDNAKITIEKAVLTVN